MLPVASGRRALVNRAVGPMPVHLAVCSCGPSPARSPMARSIRGHAKLQSQLRPAALTTDTYTQACGSQLRVAGISTHAYAPHTHVPHCATHDEPGQTDKIDVPVQPRNRCERAMRGIGYDTCIQRMHPPARITLTSPLHDPRVAQYILSFLIIDKRPVRVRAMAMVRCCGHGSAHPPRPKAAVQGPAQGTSPAVGPVAGSDTGFPFNSSLHTKPPGK